MVVDTYIFDDEDQASIKIQFPNYNKNGKLSDYVMYIDWSQDSLLNIHVDNKKDKELFFKEIKLK
jgi:hypothetical protein